MGNCGGSHKKAPVKVAGSGNPGSDNDDCDYEFKCTLASLTVAGDAGVGKTSLLLRLCNNTFTEGPALNTTGVDYDTYDVTVGGYKIRLQIWDTAGQERFRTITSSFYRGSHGIIFAFDINNIESFQNCSKWVKEADRYGDNVAGRLVVATKCDSDARRGISTADALTFAENYELKFLETSSKDDINVKEAFKQLAEMILEELEK